jgi:putative hydrolases of HD superfamily
MSKNKAIKDVLKTVQFVLEIENPKGMLRKVRLIWEERYENTAEHRWQIALFAMSMAEVDVTGAVAMSLVHDLGELDASDKFVFAQDGWEEWKAAERKALERICGMAPQKTGDLLLGLWKEFDA